MQMLLTKPYAEQVVICPHVYGPAVTHSSQGTTGQGLFQRLSASFGYLTQQGLTAPNKNRVRMHCYYGCMPVIECVCVLWEGGVVKQSEWALAKQGHHCKLMCTPSGELQLQS